MRSWPVHVLVIALARAALADEPVEPSTPAAAPPLPPMSYEVELTRATMAALAPHTGWSAGGFASAAAAAERGGRAQTVMVGGQLATPGISERCRYLRARGAVYAVADGDARHRSADVTTSVCLFRNDVVDVAAPGLAIEHHVAYDVQPSLAARRTLLRRHYTGQSVRIDGSIFEGRDATLPYASALFPYHVDVDATAQGDAHQTTWGFSVEGVRITSPETIITGDPRRPDAVVHIPADELAILGLFLRTASAGEHELTVGGLDFGRLDNLRVGAGVSMSFQFGLAMGSIVRRTAGADGMDELHEERDVFTPRGTVSAAQHRDDFTWSASYTRDAYPTVDGALAIEDRLAATLEARRGVPGVQLAGFAAHTQLYEIGGGGRGDWIAGGSAARAWALGDHLSLQLSAEAARSYYARLDGAAAPTPELAARVLALVSGHLGTR
ncbi:MAG: hypothetical protein IPL61_00290 [Myxococcales bacterium]|nr:hypothetical protein [Myxococcales bacterium]